MNKKRKEMGERKSESLTLDRCGLPCCPNVKGRENILLLSLQHNLITRIDSLSSLNQLLVLNLYDNKIEKISGLDGLVNLRVLMLGKNRIRGIEGLDNLKNLDVLDLHGNQIHFLDNLGSLKALRVLNLAANYITSVEGLQDLNSIQELNLRRNQIESLKQFAALPKLQKLHLSNNSLQLMQDIQKVAELKGLEEVSLDGNPVTLDPSYVRFVVGSCPALKVLDGNTLADSVRREAAAWMKMQKLKDEHAGNPASWRYTEIEPIQNARKQWEEMQLQKFRIAESEKKIAIVRPMTRPLLLDVDTAIPPPSTSFAARHSRQPIRSRHKRKSVSAQPPKTKSNAVSMHSTRAQIIRQIYRGADFSPARQPDPDSPKSHQKPKKSPKRRMSFLKKVSTDSGRASQMLDGSVVGERLTSPCPDREERLEATPTARPKTVKSPRKSNLKSTFREEGKDFLIKIDDSRMEVYGPSAVKRLTERPFSSDAGKSVITVLFNLVIFDTLPPVFKKLRCSFPNAINFVMNETNISNLGQLNIFGTLEKIYSLDVRTEGNGITRKPQWKLYAIYRLYHLGLRVVNGKEISVSDLERAEKEYGILDKITTILLPSLDAEQNSNKSIDGDSELSDSSSTSEEHRGKGVVRRMLKYSMQLKNDLARYKSRQSLASLLKDGMLAERNLTVLEKEWNGMLKTLVASSLEEITDMESYRKGCMRKLKKELGMK